MKNTLLPEDLHRHFRLFAHDQRGKRKPEMPLRIGGYSDAMHMIAHLVKTSITALEGMETVDSGKVAEPEINIASVLSIILDLIPYEESELLDLLFQGMEVPSVPETVPFNYSIETVSDGHDDRMYFLSWQAIC